MGIGCLNLISENGIGAIPSRLILVTDHISCLTYRSLDLTYQDLLRSLVIKMAKILNSIDKLSEKFRGILIGSS